MATWSVTKAIVCTLVGLAVMRTAWAQELGGAGTVQGTVKDPTGGVMVAVSVSLANPEGRASSQKSPRSEFQKAFAENA